MNIKKWSQYLSGMIAITSLLYMPIYASTESMTHLKSNHYAITIKSCSDIYPVREYKGFVSNDFSGNIRFVIYSQQPVGLYFDQSFYFSCIDLFATKSKLYGYCGLVKQSEQFFEVDSTDINKDRFLEDIDNRDFLIAIIGDFFANIHLDNDQSNCDKTLVPDYIKAIQVLKDGAREWKWTIPASDPKLSTLNNNKKNIEIDNFPPFGRDFLLRREKYGGISLSIKQTDDSKLIMECLLQPISFRHDQVRKIFDLRTLGQPPHVPKAYIEYHALINKYWNLKQEKNADIEDGAISIYNACTLLTDHGIPDELNRPLLSLAARAAALGGEPRLASECFDQFSLPFSEDRCLGYLGLLTELNELLDGKNVTNANVLLDKRLKGILAQKPPVEMLYQGMDNMVTKGQFRLCKIIITELENGGIPDQDVLEKYKRRIKEQEIIEARNIPDYVAEIIDLKRTGPPSGELTQKELKSVLFNALIKKELGESYSEKLTKSVCAKISAAVGNGPYLANKDSISNAVIQSDKNIWPRCEDGEDTASWLAGLLSLSFYDKSTENNHDELIGQVSQLIDHVVETMWTELGTQDLYGEILTKKELRDYAHKELKNLKDYINSPLWPMFKYPLSLNELERIKNRMVTRTDKEISRLKSYAERMHDPKSAEEYLINRMIWLTKSIYGRIVSVRLPSIVGLGFEATQLSPLRITWKLEIHEDRKEEAERTLSELVYFYIGHRALSGPLNNDHKSGGNSNKE